MFCTGSSQCVEHHLSGPRDSGPKRTVSNRLNDKAMCGGALFNRFVTVLGKKQGHQQRSTIFWDLAGPPQAAIKKIR